MEVSFNIAKHNLDLSKPPEVIINHEWFSKILLTMGDAVIATDKKGDVTAMNKVAEELTGWKQAEASGKPIDTIFDAINDHTHLPVENPVNKALNENRVLLLSNHTILIKKDKTQRYIADSAIPIHNAAAEVIGGALIFRDVTEQSVNQKKLTESEGLLKGIMANTTLVIDIKDLEGKYILINKQKENIFNIRASELIGKKSAEHLTMEQADTSRRTDIEVMKQNRLIEYDEVIKHQDGAYHNYHTSKFPLYDSENTVYAICSISADISESKISNEIKELPQLPEIILKNENQYNEVTKNMPSMFFSFNSSLQHTSFNKACEKFTGRTEEQVMGKTIEEAFPYDVPLFLTEYKEVLETGKAKNFISTFTNHKRTSTYVVNIYPTEKGISVLMTDLTMQNEEETETLELIDSLEKKNKELQQFAYAVSHDLRAPIARVLWLMNMSGANPEYKINNRTLLENVINEVTNLENVVKDMHTVISARDGEKQKEYSDFEMELNLIKKVLENEISTSKAFITHDFKKQEGIVTVKSYLHSIIYNLLSNAIKYRSLEVPLTIHLETQQDNEFICFSVKDNGRGIDLKKDGDKIFGLYTRFHGKEIEGRGIGLNLVKTQVESLNGKVEVESEVEQGSTFKIYLPATL